MKRLFSLFTWALLVISPLFFAAGCGGDGDDDDDVTVQYTLTITPASGGTITASPASASGKYDKGTVVTLTATPNDAAAMMLEAWSGDASVNTSPTTVTMNADKTVSCTFTEVPDETYTLTVNSTTNGTISLDPATGPYAAGTEVTVTATPSENYALSAWSGDLSGTENPTTITMNGDKTIGATFDMVMYTITYDATTNGTYVVNVDGTNIATVEGGETPPAAAEFPVGSEVTIAGTPDSGYVLDGGYNAFFMWYMQVAFFPPDDASISFDLTGDRNVGFSFVAEPSGYTITKDVEYAKPGIKSLTYDVYVPDSAVTKGPYPLVVVIHGGGLDSGDEDVMRGLAKYMMTKNKYVVACITYRFSSADGEKVTTNNIIEDAFGAICHLRAHFATYNFDPDTIAITGDSSGGYLTAMMGNAVTLIGTGGWGTTEDVYEYWPTGLAEGDVATAGTELLAAFKAIAPSYGHYTNDQLELSAYDLIPDTAQGGRTLPPTFVIVGTNDFLLTSNQEYRDALTAAGQSIEYHEVDGASHAFFDWKSDAATQATFAQYGEPGIDLMITFFDTVFYPAP